MGDWQICVKKSRIRETLNLSTDADRSTNTKTDRKGQFWGPNICLGCERLLDFLIIIIIYFLAENKFRVERLRDFYIYIYIYIIFHPENKFEWNFLGGWGCCVIFKKKIHLISLKNKYC